MKSRMNMWGRILLFIFWCHNKMLETRKFIKTRSLEAGKATAASVCGQGLDEL